MEITLSILIATMPKREHEFAQMISMVQVQQTNEVEILFDGSMGYNIGVKRNKLLERSKGDYICFIDDDDEIASNYVSLILEACKSGADCIGISGIITTNGSDKRQWHISKDYGYWHEKDGVYLRTPNHISPVKRELALKAGFPEISFGEDAVYSERLLSFLNTEVKIEQNIYHYKYCTK
jgi:glycosyltransferase involved in cell wall biosynthesis